ncbi:MAG TPA: hypothetical protein VF261_00780 [Candidatus Saccharimonadales bacterium]
MNTRHVSRHDLTPEQNDRRVRNVLASASVATLFLGGGAVAASVAAEHAFQAHEVQQRQAMGETYLKSVHELVDGRVVIPAGVNARKSREIQNGGSDTPSNIGYTVPEGRELVVQYPSITQSKNGDYWLAFHHPGASPEDTTVDYVDVSALARQGMDGVIDVENHAGTKGGPLEVAGIESDYLRMVASRWIEGNNFLGPEGQVLSGAMQSTEAPAQ